MGGYKDVLQGARGCENPFLIFRKLMTSLKSELLLSVETTSETDTNLMRRGTYICIAKKRIHYNQGRN